jgi:hypothetical protein
MQPSVKEILLRIADEVLHSILQGQFTESCKQDLAVIDKLAEVYGDDCKYYLLLFPTQTKFTSSILGIKSQV